MHLLDSDKENRSGHPPHCWMTMTVATTLVTRTTMLIAITCKCPYFYAKAAPDRSGTHISLQ